mgnify:CR=1 FL=1
MLYFILGIILLFVAGGLLYDVPLPRFILYTLCTLIGFHLLDIGYKAVFL